MEAYKYPFSGQNVSLLGYPFKDEVYLLCQKELAMLWTESGQVCLRIVADSVSLGGRKSRHCSCLCSRLVPRLTVHGADPENHATNRRSRHRSVLPPLLAPGAGW